MRRWPAIALWALCLAPALVWAQALQSFQIPAALESIRPNSNSVSVIAVGTDTVWMGTGNGLSFTRAGGDRLDEPEFWSKIDEIPDADLWAVRLHLKRKLSFYLRERVRDRWTAGGFHPVQVVSSGVLINPYALTIGFARRFATYKRASLIMRDVDRLLEIVNRPNMPVQILFAGKAHPADEPGKQLIQQVYRTVKKAETGGRIVFLEDYDMNLARYLVQGVDVWLNTPRRPYEASGTSGMKAALNGALYFSVLDGWWREAYNGRNGWSIGEDRQLESQSVQDAEDASCRDADAEVAAAPRPRLTPSHLRPFRARRR